jgi:hypothetical protein
VEGIARDKDDQPAPGATVVLVPELALRGQSDRFKDVVADQAGRYRFENVAPGEYQVFAWDDVEPDSWFDPEFFREIEGRGAAVKLEVKGHQTVTAHLVGK